MTLAGLPIVTALSGMSFVTTAPAPIIAPSPMVIPSRSVALAPMLALFFMVIPAIFLDLVSSGALSHWLGLHWDQ